APALPAPERGASLWRNADFLRLWSAQTISQFGTQITALALPLAAILILDASATEVALLTALEWLPWLLISLPAGALVDRMRRRPVLVLADVGRGVALASVPAAYAFDALTLWQLYGVGFLVGVLTVFFDVAYQSYLPSLVERRQLGEGNSKLEVSRSGAGLAGPGLAGVLIELVRAPVAILADAISFFVSALLLVTIRREERFQKPQDGTRLWHEIVEGIRYVLGDPVLRPSMAFVATSNFFGNVMWTIFLVYAVRRLEWSPGTIGLVLTLGNLGFLAGAVLAPRIGAKLGVGRTLVGAAMLGGWPLLAVPLAPADHAVPLIVGALVVASFGGVVYNVVGISLFQAITPDRLLGRMNASRRFVVWGVIPLGSLVSGGLAAWIGLRPTLLVGAVGSAIAFLPLLFSPVWALRDVPEEDAAATPAPAA
ncbi:MAG: MFS transporter, partial [Gaiellaceae bacterium]